MVTLFAKHKVEDFDAWKRVYDDFGSTRSEWGVRGASVHRSAEDPNDVTVTHKFDDLDSARKFAGADELKSAMMDAGVVGRPDIWIVEDVEETSY